MFKMFSFLKRLQCRAKAAYTLPLTLNFTNTNLVEQALLASDEERELLLAEEYRITAVLRMPAPVFRKDKQTGLLDFKFQVLGTPSYRKLKVRVLHSEISEPLNLELIHNSIHEYYLSFQVPADRRGGVLLPVVVLIDPIGD